MDNQKHWQVEFRDRDISDCWVSDAVTDYIPAPSPEEALALAMDYLDENCDYNNPVSAQYDYFQEHPYTRLSSLLEFRVHEVYYDDDGEFCEGEFFYF